MVALTVAGIPVPVPMQLFGLGMVIATAGMWRNYVRSAKDNGIPPLARQVLERTTMPVQRFGYVLPAALLIAGLVVPSMRELAVPLAGVAAIAGGVWWKFTVIVRASYTQGFSLKQVPHRGSGERAAPVRLSGFSERSRKNAAGA